MAEPAELYYESISEFHQAVSEGGVCCMNVCHRKLTEFLKSTKRKEVRVSSASPYSELHSQNLEQSSDQYYRPYRLSRDRTRSLESMRSTRCLLCHSHTNGKKYSSFESLSTEGAVERDSHHSKTLQFSDLMS